MKQGNTQILQTAVVLSGSGQIVKFTIRYISSLVMMCCDSIEWHCLHVCSVVKSRDSAAKCWSAKVSWVEKPTLLITLTCLGFIFSQFLRRYFLHVEFCIVSWFSSTRFASLLNLQFSCPCLQAAAAVVSGSNALLTRSLERMSMVDRCHRHLL